MSLRFAKGTERLAAVICRSIKHEEMPVKKLSLTLFLGGLVVSVAMPAAEAQGFKIRKDSLEQVDWFHDKRHVQIVDDDMEVHDLRRRKGQVPYVEIRLDPIDTTPGYAASGAAGTSADSSIPAGGLRVGQGPGTSAPPAWKTTLPESGFGQSYIPTRRQQMPVLPAGYNTGVHASLMQARSAAGSPPPTRLANRGDYIKPPLKTYPRYGAGSSGNGSTQYNYSGQVHGLIKRGSLINSRN